MSDAEYHMVEFSTVGGTTQLVRGKRKTEAEMQAEAEAEASQVVAEPAVLQVQIVEGCTTQCGKAILLCDQHGIALPNQVRATLDQTEGRTEITVTFLVDGEEVIFA